jgi:hypothetical protein
MQEKSGAYLRLIKRLRLHPGSPEAALAAGAWSLALELAHPATFCESLDREAFIECFEPHARASSHLMTRLEGCGSVWILAATIGPSLEERARDMFTSGQAFSGYVLDYFGTWLVDQALRREIAGLRRRIGTTTIRLSPGTKDFPLAAQAMIVKLAGRSLGLSLTSANLLIPQKSVTTVLGHVEQSVVKQPGVSQ